MAFQLYPEDEARLRQRIREIVLDHIRVQGGVLAGGRRRKKRGGIESHRQHRIGAEKNPFIAYMHEYHLNPHEAAKAYKKVTGMGYDIGGVSAGGRKRRKRGGVLAGGKKKKSAWLKMVAKYRKQGYSMKQISKMYHGM